MAGLDPLQTEIQGIERDSLGLSGGRRNIPSVEAKNSHQQLSTNMSDPVVDFYDRMSVEYHHNMGFNWEESVRDEGAILHKFLLRSLGKPGPFTVLDCTCGIGT